MSTVDGLAQALQDEAGDRPTYSFLPDPEQLELLRDEEGALPKNALQILRRQERERGRGRPPGARNKASKQIANYFFKRWGNPLDALGEIISTPTDVLCDQMRLAQGGESKSKPVRAVDAAHLRLKAIDIALPYLIGKQPVSIDLNTKADVILNIPGLTDPAHLAVYVNSAELSEEDLERIDYAEFAPVDDARGTG